MIEIAPSALDEASNRLWLHWQHHRIVSLDPARPEGEGLFSWLKRAAEEAIAQGETLPSGKIRHKGLKFRFLPVAREHDGAWREWQLLQGVEAMK